MNKLNNAKKLDKMRPIDTISGMTQNFSNQPNQSAAADVFDKLIKSEYPDILSNEKYVAKSPKDKVLMFCKMFHNLYQIYIKHLNILARELSNEELSYTRTAPRFTKSQYDTMPKRFRDAFVKYDDDNYIFNTYTKPIIISVSNKQKPLLLTLLKRAKALISILDSHTKSAQQSLFQRISFHLFISDEELAAIKELNNIFLYISRFTLPRTTAKRDKKSYGSLIIYDEYMDGLTRKNCVAKANKVDKRLKNLKNIKHEQGSKDIDSYYEQIHRNTLSVLKMTISTRIK